MIKRVVVTMSLMCMVAAVAKGDSLTVWAEPKHDAKGNLLPLKPYGETIARGAKFILDDQAVWAKGNKIRDEQGNIRPPYFFHCVAIGGQLDGAGVESSRNTAYPAHQHAIYIRMFLDYYVYSGRKDVIERAEELAEWNIAHSTPAEWPYGSLPYSTVTNGRVGGSVDGDSLMVIKPAIMAETYLRLYRATGKQKYREAAERIADTLLKTQLPAGNWPLRVNPKTGEVRDEYVSGVIYVIELFEQLDELNKTRRFAAARSKALDWLLKGPAKDMNWNGFFEDVGKQKDNRINHDCMDTIRWLLRHRAENADYLPLAWKLYDWVRKTFVDEQHRYQPAQAVREQLVCNYRMAGHAAHWAYVLADLYEVTRDESYRTAVINEASLITYHMQPDGRISIGPEFDESQYGFWFSNQFYCLMALMDILGYVPEMAPDGESHLLRATGLVRSISYEDGKVAYTTDAPSSDLLKLAFDPRTITLNGKPLEAGDGLTRGWKFDPQTKVLRLTHQPGNVVLQAVPAKP